MDRSGDHDFSDVRDTIVAMLRQKADDQPDKVIYSYLGEDENVAAQMTYAKLDQDARRIGARLQELHASGERALLIYPPGLAYISGFMGCLYAGVVAVPAYPPDPAKLDQILPKLLAIASDSQASLILTTSAVMGMAEKLFPMAPQLGQIRWLATDQLTEDSTSVWKPWDPEPSSLAYLQYTSGSTRQPKGVCLSHTNLITNTIAISRSFMVSHVDVVVLWLPMYHNMGLVGGVLQPFFSGCACYLMSPLAFLQQPARWLRAISKYRGTIAGCPNFGFDLCAQRIPAEQRARFDLRSWTVAFNGAEPVRADTLERFSRGFAECGFRREAFFPCYGLAESTLMVTTAKRGGGPVITLLDRKALNGNRVIPSDSADPSAVKLVSSGKTFSGQELRVVDPETLTECTAGRVGELWIRGPSVAQGYWNLPEESARTFNGFLANGQGPFLRSGDLAFIDQGECFITGRLKDLIILHGQNHYPQDLEAAVMSSQAGFLPNSGAAFSVDVAGEERLVVVQEVHPAAGEDLETVARVIREKIFDTDEIQTYAVVLVEDGQIPKTQSGKVSRQPCRQLYLAGQLKIIYEDRLDQPSPLRPAPQEQPGGAGEKVSLLHKALLALGPEGGRALVTSHLQGLLSDVLHIPPERIEVDKPLSGMGLDSILSIHLVQEVEATLDITVPMAVLLQGITLAELADTLLEQVFAPKPQSAYPSESTADKATIPPEQVESRNDLLAAGSPLSYGQRALWFVQRLAPDSIAHNLAFGVRILNDLDISALRRSFERVSLRHAMLRATFEEVDGQPVQRVHAQAQFEFAVEEGQGLGAEAVDERLEREAWRPFDLERGPLMRVFLLRIANNETILLLSMHHIITDMWSMAILLNELGQLYTDETGGNVPSINPLAADAYLAEVRQQLEMVSSAEGEAHWDYWRERLAGDLPYTRLIADRSGPAVRSGLGAAKSITLGVELTRALHSLSQNRRVNPFSVLFSAFNVLLSRYTGETDVLVGTLKAGRTRRNAWVVGYFINPVVIRSDLAGDPTFSELLERVHASIQADFDHDVYPFPLLVERLQPARENGQGALFQALFSWQKTTRILENRGVAAFALGEDHTPIQIGNFNLETMALTQRPTPTDLALLVVEREDELGITIEYNTDLYTPITVERLLRQYACLLSAAASNADRPISQLPMGSAVEQQTLLTEWAAPHASPTATTSIYAQVRDQADRTPQAAALAFMGKEMTYAELEQRSAAIGRRLIAAGARPGQVVGAFLERSFESVAALLGILKAGGVYLPLDPENPDGRLDYLIGDSGTKIVVTQARLSARLQHNGVRTVAVEDETETLGETTAVFPEVGLGQPAYLIYTSGSTGQPKGVLVGHRAIATHVQAMREFYQLTPADRVLQFASLNFDASLEQIFTTLTSGACLCLRDVELWDPAIFAEKIAERKLTVINLPPAYWQQWVQSPGFKTPLPEASTLRLVILGGDVVSVETLRTWKAGPWGNVRLINAYGPTETIITATAYEIPIDGESRAYARVPIGTPIPGRRAYVLDPQGRPVSVGVPGELYLGGDCLATGYLNQPERTAERFISDPFASKPEARMYRTGDSVRWLPDGNLEFLGRVDRQIKVRGIRIEPGEIEQKMNGVTGVREALVLPLSSEQGTFLAGFVIPKAGATLDPRQVLEALSKVFPAYMLPGAILVMEAWPYTLGGKIDREALAQTVRSEMKRGSTRYQSPRNEVETRLACMWADLLNRDRVGMNESFFNLGGHSLLATQLVSRIRTEYGVEISLQQVFATPTIADLSVLIAKALAARENAGKIDALLDELESMTDDQAADLLQRDELDL